MSESLWWRSAVIRPSARAPRVIRCSCSSRCPQEVNICSRVSTSRTGRPTCRAASAASAGWCQIIALEPKLPPTAWLTTRIEMGGRPSSSATVNWIAFGPWVES